jgi:hypothetical protein
MENIRIFYCYILELVSGRWTGTCVRKLKKADNEAFTKARIRIFRSVRERERGERERE